MCPILNIDKFGRLYETDPDMQDGSGYKGQRPTSGHGDVTFGAAYINAEQERIKNEVSDQVASTIDDLARRKHANMMGALRVKHHRKEQRKLLQSQTQQAQDAITRQGAMQTIRAQHHNRIGISGDGFSSDGVYGEKKLQNLGVDPLEYAQYDLNHRVNAQLGAQGSTLQKRLPTAPLRVVGVRIPNPLAHPLARRK